MWYLGELLRFWEERVDLWGEVALLLSRRL